MKRKPIPRHWDLRQRLEFYTDYRIDCWEWTGCIVHGGHGIVTFDDKTLTAHRASWMVHRGEIPKGMYVLHQCDNPKCIRPDHLYLGTQHDNMRDREERGRTPVGERTANHVLNEALVLTLRREVAEGTRSLRSICHKYGVNPGTGLAAVRGRSWKHLDHAIGGGR